MPEHWRDAITTVAERSRDAMRRHPWILDIADDPPIGPNSVRHFDQSLAAVASLPITLAEKLDIVTVVDEYVFGYSLLERNNLQEGAQSVPADMVAYVERLTQTGEYPQLAALSARDRPRGRLAAGGGPPPRRRALRPQPRPPPRRHRGEPAGTGNRPP